MRSGRERDGAGPGPTTSADMELPPHVAPGGLVLFLKFLIEMFQQSQFSFGREGRMAGWGAAASQGFPPGSSLPLFAQGIGCSGNIPSEDLF